VVVFNFEWPLLLSLLASTVFPLLVGLVTTRETSEARKAVYLALLSVLTPLATELASALTTGATYDLGQALFVALSGFLVAVGLHFGLWKPTGVSAAVQDAGPQHRQNGPLG
jgi:hypothetical protein